MQGLVVRHLGDYHSRRSIGECKLGLSKAVLVSQHVDASVDEFINIIWERVV